MLKAQPSRFESTDKLQGEERGLMDCCCCGARAEYKTPRTLFTRPPLDGNTHLIPNEAPLKATCITLCWGMTFWVLSGWGLIIVTPSTASSKEKIIKWCICCKLLRVFFFILCLQGLFVLLLLSFDATCPQHALMCSKCVISFWQHGRMDYYNHAIQSLKTSSDIRILFFFFFSCVCSVKRDVLLRCRNFQHHSCLHWMQAANQTWQCEEHEQRPRPHTVSLRTLSQRSERQRSWGSCTRSLRTNHISF